jgi:hypothetical protein
MLAHSPPLPLIIDHLYGNDDITAEDEEGIILALQHRDRVRRIRLVKPIPILQKLISDLDGEFPILEYMLIQHQRFQSPLIKHNTNLSLPETFRAPHLCHLMLMNFAIPIGSPLLTNMGNLVTLSLQMIPPSAYFHPDALLQRLSLIPQLETIGVTFGSYYPSGDVKRQLLRSPMTRVTHPNLRWLGFRGASAYLEALLPWVTAPLLEKLQLLFFEELTYSFPHLQQFMSTAENLRLETATLSFHEDCLSVVVSPHEGTERPSYALGMNFSGRRFDWQLASTARALHTLRPAFSTVEHLTLAYERGSISPEWNDEADRTQWRELLGSFGGVKTLRVGRHYRLIKQLSRALQPGEGESPTELFPELRELDTTSDLGTGTPTHAFTVFIDSRQKAGRPVTMVYSGS